MKGKGLLLLRLERVVERKPLKVDVEREQTYLYYNSRPSFNADDTIL